MDTRVWVSACFLAMISGCMAGYDDYYYGYNDEYSYGTPSSADYDYSSDYSWNPYSYYDYYDSDNEEYLDEVELCWEKDNEIIYNGTFCDVRVKGTAALTRFDGSMDGFYRVEGCHNGHPMYKKRLPARDVNPNEEHLHIMYSTDYGDWGFYDHRMQEEKAVEEKALAYGGGHRERSPEQVMNGTWNVRYALTPFGPEGGNGQVTFVALSEMSVECADEAHNTTHEEWDSESNPNHHTASPPFTQHDFFFPPAPGKPHPSSNPQVPSHSPPPSPFWYPEENSSPPPSQDQVVLSPPPSSLHSESVPMSHNSGSNTGVTIFVTMLFTLIVVGALAFVYKYVYPKWIDRRNDGFQNVAFTQMDDELSFQPNNTGDV